MGGQRGPGDPADDGGRGDRARPLVLIRSHA
jgi:hypothetical protein